MRKKMLFSYIIIILLAIIISGLAFWLNGYDFIMDQSKEYHLSKTELLTDVFIEEVLDDREDYQAFVSRFAKKYKMRITLIDTYGTVYVDSADFGITENHKERKEFITAMNGQNNIVNRYSSTMNGSYAYAAVRVQTKDFDGVLRTATLLSEITTLNNKLGGSIGITIVACFAIAILAALAFTRSLSKPIIEVSNAATRIANGELDIRIHTRETDQIAMLAGAFNVMSGNLKHTIEEIKLHNAELQAILTSISGSIVAINASNEIMYYNPAFYELCNSKLEELKGKSIYNVIRHLIIFKTIEEVREKQIRIVNDASINNTTHLKITATPIISLETEAFGVLLLLEDVSKIRKLENMRRDFVSNVTHELKTPLTSIRGFIETLKNGAIHDKGVATRFLDIIDLEAERLFLLIQDILTLSEIESKKEEEGVFTNINSVIESVIELLQTKVSNEVIIHFTKDHDLKDIYCNPARMKQLFINLIENGVKYTEKGIVTITTFQKNDEIIISVKDTGIGIEEEYQERIFERFYRVDKGRARKQGGTGLGLSIVKHIVELYHGTITVNSKPLEGTEFIVNLPLEKS